MKYDINAMTNIVNIVSINVEALISSTNQTLNNSALSSNVDNVDMDSLFQYQMMTNEIV